MFLGRPWDCGKTFEKVFRLLHPHPSPFSRLFLGSLAVSLHFFGPYRSKRPTVGTSFSSRANSQLLKMENCRQLSFTTFR